VRIEYILPARASLVDVDRKSVSIVEIVEEIVIATERARSELPLQIPLHVAMCFVRESEEGKLGFNFRIDIINPEREVSRIVNNQACAIEAAHKRVRFRFETLIIPVTTSGRYIIRVSVDGLGLSREYHLDVQVIQASPAT
jgi:hypothetical protein